MSGMRHFAVILLAAPAVAMSTAMPASADHPTCAGGRTHTFVGATVPGTVGNGDTSDFWLGSAVFPATSDIQYVLVPEDGDADLYIWNSSCTAITCESINLALEIDQCGATKGQVAEVQFYSGGIVNTATATYTLFAEDVFTIDP